MGSESLLTLVLNRSQSMLWKNNINIRTSGPQYRASYYGFLQKEIMRYWPKILGIEDRIKKKSFYPKLMTFEVAQSIMKKIVNEHRDKGGFQTLNQTSDKIAIELTSNLFKFNINCLSIEEGERLLIKSLSEEESSRIEVIKESTSILNKYMDSTLEKGILDYATSIYIYNKCLLEDEHYIENLSRQFSHIIVDNMEEAVPSMVNFISKLEPKLQGCTLFFNPQGGYGTTFGSNINYTRQYLFKNFKPKELTRIFSSNEELISFSESLGGNIVGKPIKKAGINKKVVIENPLELKSDMLQSMVVKTEELLDKGIKPSEIVIITPQNDAVLEYVFTDRLKSRGIRVTALGRKARLTENPFINAIMVIACLCHPKLKLDVNYDDIKNTLALITSLDAVRASLLAHYGYSYKEKALKSDIRPSLAERIGFHNVDKFNYIVQWIESYKNDEALYINEFFKRVFLEILVTLPAASENLIACRQLIDSSATFVNSMEGIYAKDIINKEYLELILEGVKGAESIYDLEENLKDNYIVIATPYAVLSRSVECSIQLWSDVSSDAWTPSGRTPLSNNYIYGVREDALLNYNETMEREFMAANLKRIANCLPKKCKDTIFIFQSNYSSKGYEQESILKEALDRLI